MIKKKSVFCQILSKKFAHPDNIGMIGRSVDITG